MHLGVALDVRTGQDVCSVWCETHPRWFLELYLDADHWVVGSLDAVRYARGIISRHLEIAHGLPVMVAAQTARDLVGIP